jgi:hypothetical protein
MPTLDDPRPVSGALSVGPGLVGRSGSAGALPLHAVDQSRRPALADIIGARRVRTAVMISSGSIPCR